MHGVEVEEPAGVDGVHRQSRQAVQWRAFNRNAEGDQGVVDHSPAVADLVV